MIMLSGRGPDGGTMSNKELTMTLSIIKNILTDGSATFDLLLQDDEGGSVTLWTDSSNESHANHKANKLHVALEALGSNVEWADMLINRG
jgi:hypothetical protein